VVSADHRRGSANAGSIFNNGNGRGNGRPIDRRRTFIDANGLECEERSRVLPNGDREYDLKCREQKHNRGRGYGRGNDRGDDVCYDRDRDGRCDVGWDIGRTYPTTLPDMITAILFGQGRRTQDVTQWLGAGRYTARYTDRDRNQRPELVSWVDAAGVLLQQWTDSNGDGRADVVRIYRDGRLARVIGR
jgi:hypothetical protein